MRVNGRGSPVVAGGVFVYDRWENQLHAFDVTDGRHCWSTGEEFFRFSANSGWAPSVSGRTVYTVLGDALVALDAASGDERWRFYPPRESSLAFGWRRDSGDPPRLHVPAVADENVYLVSPDGFLFALRAETGALLRQATIAEPDAGPVVGRDLVYVTSNRETTPALTAFDRASGEVRWTLPYGGDPVLVTIRGGPVRYLADAGALRAVDAATGADLWSVPLEGETFTRADAAGDQIFIANNAGTVFSLIDTDEIVQPPAATPAAATPAGTPDAS
ncbi:MAG: PQQ-binding-like beta-propeller repeat protein [Thermomicrobiales bacterium]